MIKGHSIIELRNVKTSEVERYEDDNIVTNALSFYLQDLGALNISPIFDDGIRNNPIAKLMGGLLLFDDSITENANTVICPGGIKMVGNGSYNVTADGADGVTELGSWNSTESGWMSDGSYKMVWDFATTQANGTIACACLTSQAHGYVGEGNSTSNTSRSSKGDDLANKGTAQEYNVDEDNTSIISRIINISRTNNTITYVDNYNLYYNLAHASEHMGTTGKIKLVTKKLPLSKFDLRQSVPYNNNDGENYVDSIETEVNLPAAFVSQLGNASPWYAEKCGSNFYMIATSLDNLAAGATVQGVKVTEAGVVTGFTISNTLNDTLHTNNNYIGFGNNIVAIARTSNYGGGVLFQDITNNADSDLIEVNADVADRYFRTMNYDDYCIIGGVKIDFTDRTVIPVNELLPLGMNTKVMSDNPLVMVYRAQTGIEYNVTTLRLVKSTNYLATINNLQTAVTKTAEKTMKVTYVLRFSDGE